MNKDYDLPSGLKPKGMRNANNSIFNNIISSEITNNSRTNSLTE